ncbi:hypothetical protein Tco_0421249 [Tanacetum coccineum]
MNLTLLFHLYMNLKDLVDTNSNYWNIRMMGLVIREGSGNNNDGTPPFSKEQTEGCLSAPNAALHEAGTGGVRVSSPSTGIYQY